MSASRSPSGNRIRGDCLGVLEAFRASTVRRVVTCSKASRVPSRISVARSVVALMATVELAFHQQAADELGGNQLGRAVEETAGQGWEVVGGRGGYGSGFVRKC